MSTPRDDLKNELVAVIEAARELPEGDRDYLADVFLRELDTRYNLVPRTGSRGRSRGVDDLGPSVSGMLRRFWPLLAAGVALLVLFPLLMVSMFEIGRAHV